MKSLITKYSASLKKDAVYSWTMLILRVVLGIAMMLHGLKKIQSPFDWMGPDAPVPGIFQSLAAVSEFGGGLAWILGLLTPLASLGMFFTMVVATLTHVMRGDAFVGAAPTYELALIYCLFSLFIMLNGPGKISLDSKIFSR